MRKSKGFGLLEWMITLVVSLLAAIPVDHRDQHYAYFNIATAGPGNGNSKRPLNAKASRNGIVRANNGVFIGLAEDY